MSKGDSAGFCEVLSIGELGDSSTFLLRSEDNSLVCSKVILVGDWVVLLLCLPSQGMISLLVARSFLVGG